jgi:hypothetical protein
MLLLLVGQAVVNLALIWKIALKAKNPVLRRVALVRTDVSEKSYS